MLAQYAPSSVGAFCQAMEENLVIVNEEYQRNAGIWNSYARSYFIESILLQFPIPKMFLYAKTDLARRNVIKEIVDGQQRSHTLRNYYNNKFALSSKLDTEELRGKKYRQLDPRYQEVFISYSLPIDEFRGVTPEEIQESFRRMNASNVPLNEEETRNARYQGNFKVFINRACRAFSESLRATGVLTRPDIIRMKDSKLYAEIMHSVLYGFQTVKGPTLDRMYKQFDKEFLDEDMYLEYLRSGIHQAVNSLVVGEREFQRTYMFQSLVLVFIDREFGLGLLKKAQDAAPGVAARLQGVEVDYSALIDALRSEEPDQQFREFCASTKGTNVGEARAVRFLFINSAV